jgi:hypothetical protein
MSYKIPLGILAGFGCWWAAFFLIGYSAVFINPALLEAVRPAIADNDWSLITTSMFIGAIVMYFFINPLAGWITVFITRNKIHAAITALPLTLYAISAHWFRLWGILPGWYNIMVVLLIPPLVYLGGYFVKESTKTETNQ